MTVAAAVATRPKPRPKRAADITVKSPNARTRADFARLITEAWQSTLEGIFQTGLRLETAKAELPHGEWLLMAKNDLPFSHQTAAKLMVIAADERLSNDAHVRNLPISWGTLVELTKLDDETFDAAIVDGRINPKMERKDALALRPARPRRPRKPKAAPAQPAAPAKKAADVTAGPIGPVDLCAMQVRALIFKFVDEMPAEQWPALIAELRDELDDIEKELTERRASA